MRILFYNWVDYLDDDKRGGGVTVYQRNLIRALADQPDIEAVFLSAGISYDLLSDRPRWERLRHGPAENRANRYEIVNSGVLSPSHHSFGNPAQVTQPETMAAFVDFLRRMGPFDVVHFNNLEGLPAEALALKQQFPQTRVVLSLHNYYPFCPQVNLWFQERENCRDFADGRKCEVCLPHRHDERVVRLANALAFTLKKWGVRPGTRLFDRAFRPTMHLARRGVGLYLRLRRLVSAPAKPALDVFPDPQGRAAPQTPRQLGFQSRRADMVGLINRHCDMVLGVSNRVCDIAAHFGIAPGLLRTSYIGTNQAEKFDLTVAKPSILRPDGTLTLAYLGYMRQDKGFFFLLDALEALPTEVASRLRLVICAARGDEATMDRIAALRARFAGLSYVDGYSHDHLDDLLAEVDLGVIPVLWEDNLPQVAIEMHARHIPLLTSDLGGAKELSHCPEMVFAAGSITSFAARIDALLTGKITPQAYWKDAQHPVSMPDHLVALRTIWARRIVAPCPAEPCPAEPRAPLDEATSDRSP